ncbi:sulfate transporter [Aquimarina aggregata]|uniref:Sulfate transporter n=1 Tax=Aquimarina aggregata TaxID=1642818 RepID=A0A162CXD1_9FLAO|nr:sulfate permease [Aquimarina aggregata]KZS42489.1 sulfate transporter [Aquimarina aggregata]
MLKRFFPIFDWLSTYKKEYLPGDLFAGLTVGIMLIPQGMAYAMIAGLPPIFGLYASLIPQVIYAIMGTSRQLAVGPVAMDSLLVASGLGALSLSGIDEYVSMAIFLALFMGAIQLFLGVLRMGFLVNFLSKPVISGFTSAAAIIIALSQLKHILGIDIAGGNRIQIVFKNTFDNISDINWCTLCIGLVAIVLIKGIKKVKKTFPAALVVVVLGIVLMYFSGWSTIGVKIMGEIPQGLPKFQVPNIEFSRISELLPIAMTLALIAFMEAISVAKAVAEKHTDYELDSNQELIALGTSNIIGSLFQSYPTTGGFSRTAVNEQAGAKTGIAPIISAIIVGLTLLFLTPLFYYLPNAVLAAIIMVAVFGLIDVKYPMQLLKSRKDEFALLLITFLITLTVGIKEGIILGVLISLIVVIYRTSKPHMAVLGRIEGTNYFKNINRFNTNDKEREDVLIVRFDAQLFFGNKDYFKKRLQKHILRKGLSLRTIILNAEAINYIDSSATHMLMQLIDELKAKKIRLIIAGAIGPTRDIIFSSGMIDKIGLNNLFVRTYEAMDELDGKEEKTKIQEKISQQTKSAV